jgi:protein-disulfide isomerase
MTSRVIALALAVSCFAAFSANAQSQIRDISFEPLAALNGDQKEVFYKVANQALCPCNCPLTLAGCLKDKPKCKRASILGRFIARGAQKGLTTMDLLTEIAEGFSGSQAAPAFKFSKAAAASLRGRPGAKIQVVEFADFRCSHCREAMHFVDTLLQQMGDKVEFSFRHFPLQNLEPSVLAAEAAEAAAAQGKLKEMHELLFKNADALSRDDLVKYATQLKLDVKRFTKELDERKHRPKVMADKEEGAKAGVQGTPAFFINGREFKLERTLENFKDRAEYEIATDTECKN